MLWTLSLRFDDKNQSSSLNTELQEQGIIFTSKSIGHGVGE
jgi:hypothetical protein